MKYKVKTVKGVPNSASNSIKLENAKNLQEEFGLFHLQLDLIAWLWESYSETYSAGWMMPDKESIEYVFNVELEEAEEEYDDPNYCGAI